ncbi:TIR domain-containing protein [Streptomyces sp. NPDC059080]|uniref:TIR domain-containing protein n=1 Tax=Streptomyces sp. NPDC059080 TaxID=3346718 RepID=UPI0036B5FD35
MSDAFLSHAPEDASWATELASRLAAHGVRVFLDEWSLLPGDVVVHRLEAEIRDTANALALISPASVASPRAHEEYAALATAGARRDLRFIPLLLGDVTLPPFAANRIWRDFRDVGAQEYDAKVAELAAVILGRAPDPATGHADSLAAALPAPPRPLTPPDEPGVVLCYVPADAAYGQALAGQLRAAGLPTWSVGDLRPGDAHFWTIRQRLRYATAIVMLMSPQSQDSDDVTRMILEGLLHDRPFFPVLLHGDRNYHLAHTWYLDARDGRLPGPDELALLRRLHDARAAGRPLDAADVLPAPLARPPVRAVRIPAATSLDGLDHALRQGEWAHADLLTTSLLLEAAGRLDDGWLRARDARRLPPGVLTGIDALWSTHSHDRQGFTAQARTATVRGTRHAEFLALSVACGWRGSETDGVERSYREFTAAAGPGGRPGFYPTLRNPQNERFPDWYDQWTATVLATHLHLHHEGIVR